MKAFEFRLQRVADFRQQQLDLAKNRMQMLAAQMQLLEDELVSLETQKNNAGNEVSQRTDLRGEDLLALSSFKDFLTRRKMAITQKKIELAKRVAEQRTEVIEAERRVKLLDRLKDRKLQEWNGAVNKELDDLAADSHMARLSAQRTSAARNA